MMDTKMAEEDLVNFWTKNLSSSRRSLVKELANVLLNPKDEIEELEEENELLQSQIDELCNVEGENEQLQGELSDAEDENEQLHDQIKELEEEVPLFAGKPKRSKYKN